MNRTPVLGFLAVSLFAACGEHEPAGTVPAPTGAADAGRRPDTAPSEMPSDPKAFVEWVRKGNLPPIAPWPRYRGKIVAPPFGAVPERDAGNPAPPGKEAWDVPVDGGTLIVQYNSAPKSLNGILDNDAVVTYINELTNPFLAWQDRVTFRYGRPSAEDPVHVFESADSDDIATGWVKEDTLVRKGAGRLFGVVTEDGDHWVVTPIAKAEGESRKAERVPKGEGDVVTRGTFVTVFLRKDVKWHDGAPFTARDVEFSVRTILNVDVNSDNIKPVFEVVESCEAVGDHAVRWVLRRQYFAADDTTVGGNLHIVPRAAYEAAFRKANPDAPFDPSSRAFAQFFNTCTTLNELPLGTGPYRVEKFDMNSRVVLVRNPDYHGPRPRADRILWRFISDAVPTIQALRSGEIDFAAHGPTAEQFGTIMQEKDFKERFVPAAWYTPSMSFIAYNRKEPRLADPRVRAALGLLLDRPGFVKAKHYGCSVLVSGDQFVSGPAYDPEVKPLAYDPAAAEELLDEAGWRDRDGDGVRDRDGVPLEFEFLITAENKALEELTAVWIEALQKAGVRLKVARMEWAAFIKRFEDKKFEAITLSWAMDPESDPHQLWHSKWADPTKPSSNATSFSDPRADALIEAIQSCLDPAERSRYQHALHRIQDADQPYTDLYCRAEIGAYNRKWRGVRLYPRRPGFDLTEWYLPAEHQGDR